MTSNVLIALFALTIAAQGLGGEENLVANGSFELGTRTLDSPDDWQAVGAQSVKQRLRLEAGRTGLCAKLECTTFSGDGPAAHAMIAQTGKVGVRKGQWYRLVFWAKGAGLERGAVEVGLANMRPWENAGLSETFMPSTGWQPFE